MYNCTCICTYTHNTLTCTCICTYTHNTLTCTCNLYVHVVYITYIILCTIVHVYVHDMHNTLTCTCQCIVHVMYI